MWSQSQGDIAGIIQPLDQSFSYWNNMKRYHSDDWGSPIFREIPEKSHVCLRESPMIEIHVDIKVGLQKLAFMIETKSKVVNSTTKHRQTSPNITPKRRYKPYKPCPRFGPYFGLPCYRWWLLKLGIQFIWILNGCLSPRMMPQKMIGPRKIRWSWMI